MIKMFKFFLFASALFLSLPLSHSYAQALSPAIIAVINIEKVERGSVAWASLTSQVNEKRLTFQKEVGELQKNLKAKSEELETQRALLSNEAFAQRVKLFQEERASLQQETTKRKKRLDKVYGIGRQQIRTALNKVIVSYTAQEKIEMVLNIGSKAGVLHYAKMDKFDISKAILDLLNVELQAVTLTE